MSARRKLRDRLRAALIGDEWAHILAKASRTRARRFLLFWNRGRGDIALGLHQVAVEIRARIPDAHLTVLTRADLAEAFRLLPVDRVLVDPELARGADGGMRAGLRRLALSTSDFDVVLERIDPTGWFADRPRLQPRLAWTRADDALAARFAASFDGVDPSRVLVGAHVESGTASFYGYRKDWPVADWRDLMARVAAEWPVIFVLFGHASAEAFNPSLCVDLRGRTSLAEMLALIKVRCPILVAPDSGVLTMTYYLDAPFPIDVVSLWADPRQGVLKHAVPSPNPALRHHPLCSRDESITSIRVDDLMSLLAPLLAARCPALAVA